MSEPRTERVLREVAAERARQTEKWGLPHHSLGHWWLILGEEIGEAAKEATEVVAEASSKAYAASCLELFRTELIQAIAVGVQIVEDLDRNKHLEPKEWR